MEEEEEEEFVMTEARMLKEEKLKLKAQSERLIRLSL